MMIYDADELNANEMLTLVEAEYLEEDDLFSLIDELNERMG